MPAHRSYEKTKKRVKVIGGTVAVLSLLGFGAPVVAGKLVTSPDIRDGAVHSKDLRDATAKAAGVRKVDTSFWIQHRLEDAKALRDTYKEAKQASNDPANFPSFKGWLDTLDDKSDGAPGPDGADGVSGYEVTSQYTRNDGSGLGLAVPVGEVQQFTVECGNGKVAIGGGVTNGNTKPGHDLTIRESAPSGLSQNGDGTWGASSWSVTVQNETDKAQHAQVFAVCASVN